MHYKKVRINNQLTIDEHRFILGIKDKNLIVHHIDGNKLNNDLDNLQVMTRSEHLKLHGFGTTCRPTPIMTFDENEIGVCRYCNESKHKLEFCKDSSYKFGYSSMCKICHSKYRKNYLKNKKLK